MKRFGKILCSSTVALIIFIMSSFSVLGGPGDGGVDPQSTYSVGLGGGGVHPQSTYLGGPGDGVVDTK